MSRAAHIGIVGCSAEGAALCYRTICTEAPARMGPYAHPEVSMHTASLGDYVDCLDRGDRQGIADLMLGSARKLAGMGAEILICPDNTIHQVWDLVAPAAPAPWLHIAEAVADAASAAGHRRLGILGTRWLTESAVYPDILDARGIGWLRPEPDEIEAIDRLIMDDLVHGRFTDPGRARLAATIASLKARGADAAILGCTELPLIADPASAALPLLDSTRLIARAALDRAIGAKA